MKKNDAIKAFVQIGLMKKPRWLEGKYIMQLENTHLVSVKNQEIAVEHGKVKKWEPLKAGVVGSDWKCEELDLFANKNWESLKNYCTNALEKFFPECSLSFNEEEKSISLQGDYLPEIHICPGIEEVESIARFFETPAWSIMYFATVPATYHEPEDVDEIHCGNARSSVHAAKILIDTVWKLKTEDYWEAIRWDDLAHEEDYA